MPKRGKKWQVTKTKTVSRSPATRKAVTKPGRRRVSASAPTKGSLQITGSELNPKAGEPAHLPAVMEPGGTSAQPVLRVIEAKRFHLPPPPRAEERPEHEAFIHGAAFVLEALSRAGIHIADLWTDVQQIAFLLYPPFELPSDVQKAKVQRDD